MRVFAKVHIVLMAAIILLTGCGKVPEDWPENVVPALFVPEKHKSVSYYRLDVTYQAKYGTDACWPAEQFISEIVNHMSKKGWQRSKEDSMNPGCMLNWASEGDIIEQWSYFADKGADIHQWIEDWEDKDRNIVRYGLKYKTKRKKNVSISNKDCDLDVVAIFIPNVTRPAGTGVGNSKKAVK